MNEIERIQQKLIDISDRAGKIILDYYQSQSYRVQKKADGSPVTDADLTANALITEELRRYYNYPIVSEEGPCPELNACERFWLIDPLDGTSEFLKRTGEFTVNLALIENTRPIISVMYWPGQKEFYLAGKNVGAFLIKAGQQFRLPLVSPARPVVMRSRHSDTPEVESFMNQYSLKESTVVGAALKFCWLAKGEAAWYPRYAPSGEWDTAAGDLLLHEANGGMVDLSTNALPSYGKAGFRNSPFLAWAVGRNPIPAAR